MSIELPQDAIDRLRAAQCCWLTTVSPSGQPVPRLVWFVFDGTTVRLYSMPSAAKVAHITAHPHVSVNLDSDGKGTGTVVLTGHAVIDATDVACWDDKPYLDKYQAEAAAEGFTEGMADYSTRIVITPTKVWDTPES